MIAASYSAISRELRQFGLVAGKNLVIEYRFHNIPGADIAAQVAELVQSDADVLVADGPESVLKAAVAATRAIQLRSANPQIRVQPRPTVRQRHGNFL